MRLNQLRVIHLKKGSLTDLRMGALISERIPEVFSLDSCQRWLWVGTKATLGSIVLPQAPGLSVLSGVEAYSFLLRVASGLESQIVGETDIFGQLKEAWQHYSGDANISALMQKVFEDTKDVRSRYIQNIGGATYGSLVRMLLRDGPGPTLLVGAGQIAQSVAPYLCGQELWLANRNPEHLSSLYSELAAKQHAGLRLIDKAGEDRAWAEAANVVICIPFDPRKDPERVALRRARPGVVIHLGGLREQAGAWGSLPGFHALEDLFALQKSQVDVRTTQVAMALRACEEKSKLRSLGSSITLPHGWEDLAVFAS